MESNTQRSYRDAEFNAAADHADQVFQQRVKALLAGEAELRATEAKQDAFNKATLYQYFTGSTGITIGSGRFNNLIKVEGINRIEYGVNGAGQYFEVWGGK